ncbi:MAG TPA: DUF389 domain-containing protein [Candidatus Kapabacteria bacterium]|nr:DUF389 domain-containing protein [Candidatus Kapabacteria bacterium]
MNDARWRRYFHRILARFDLRPDRQEFSTLHETIESGISFRGTNLWVLVFAIMIASVGLNINSTAVIIGAMLVSPLMGPIVGLGYSVATYDFQLLKKSVLNYVAAVLSGLVASTVYFGVSPLNAAHSELLARTTPSIYDVLIALFGGLAGIVAVSSKRAGTVIAGVAIATALMPPLCTAGYGIATWQSKFFFGAIYLFAINTVFIALATLLTSRLLRFPIASKVDRKKMSAATHWVSVIVIATTLPSIYFGYILVGQERFRQNAADFIRKETFIEGDYLLKADINPVDRNISLIYGGKQISDSQKNKIRSRTIYYNIPASALHISLGFSTDDLDRRLVTLEPNENELQRFRTELILAKQRYDSLTHEIEFGKDIFTELKALYPIITSGSVSRTTQYGADTSQIPHPVVLVNLNIPKQKRRLLASVQIISWLKLRFPGQDIRLLVSEEER